MLQLTFGAQLLLGDFENPVVDHTIDGEVFFDQTGADIFIEHLLDARHGNRQIAG